VKYEQLGRESQVRSALLLPRGGVKSGVKARYILLHSCHSDTTEDARNTAVILHFALSDYIIKVNGVQEVEGGVLGCVRTSSPAFFLCREWAGVVRTHGLRLVKSAVSN
jgi:hypothetical protein